MRKVHDGLDFLGYIVRPDYLLVRKRVINNFNYKKAKYLNKYESIGLNKEDTIKFQSIKASFLGYIQHSNSYRLRQNILKGIE